jgi:L-threonylcarbamoyladenylate synthase
LTDPLIVHVNDIEKAKELVVQDDLVVMEIFEALAAEFWPGPLTIISKANLDLIPMLITAQTGYVGIRSPNHPVARELISAAGVPIAAPSANKFGHVSPTTAEHVLKDFVRNDVCIIDGGKTSFGIESTVLKITNDSESGLKLKILRRGGTSFDQITKYLS